MADSAQQAIAPINEKGVCNYNVAGQDVRLSYQIVRDYLVKGGGKVSDQDLVQFISICKFNQLNPFLGVSIHAPARGATQRQGSIDD